MLTINMDDLIVGSIEAESRAGKSHVIFGKTDGTVIELSAITSGTGGFVINDMRLSCS
jgi:hypothetical protein